MPYQPEVDFLYKFRNASFLEDEKPGDLEKSTEQCQIQQVQ